jgi:hypothetical protein
MALPPEALASVTFVAGDVKVPFSSSIAAVGVAACDRKSSTEPITAKTNTKTSSDFERQTLPATFTLEKRFITVKFKPHCTGGQHW